ncbi:hypothetical protein [Kineococcus esterisolvens]|uniref:hypothetical protein n=1 Tax=unclassified Kineococcus TaxID=2621656 RepID=UPI003D7D9A03
MPAIKTDARTENWVVAFSHGGEVQHARVAVIEGYTTLADVPKIIAIPRGVDPEDIQLHALALESVDNDR